MHAIVAHVTIDPTRINEAEQQLHELVVPTVKGAKGFFSGIWTQSDDGRGVGFTTWESEEDAQAFVVQWQSMERPADSPVTLDSMDVYRVVATA